MAALHALYTAIWANFWTPSAPTLAGLAWHFIASQRAHRRRQQDLKEHITATANKDTP